MEKTLFITAITLLITINTFGQEGKTNLARVQKISGVYIFIQSEPAMEYDFVRTIKHNQDYKGNIAKSITKIVKKARKKNPNFNGMIFHQNEFHKVDLIVLGKDGVKIGGFKLGDLVTFMDLGGLDKKLRHGIIVAFGKRMVKNQANIEYTDDNGKKNIKSIPYARISKRN